MTNERNPVNPERSLLDEIEELDVLEAEELQEGVAFHAFRFHAASQMEAMTFFVNAQAGALALNVNLPNGATLMDADGNKLRILFDPNAVDAQDVQAAVVKDIGANVTGMAYNENDKFQVVKV
ncbi:hypothetical protein [Paraliomyxa miuraensis]|uniref:hypothetical protein n=1 Tax=Paraliomyxa miuraensis TaxID=376150 RepID=UPI0022534ECD|nr:hypothetical protein [Paraliomyxa miuraensis]MCX4245098.1 hypothetical protein [Paraliomyxa miuraensis]